MFFLLVYGQIFSISLQQAIRQAIALDSQQQQIEKEWLAGQWEEQKRKADKRFSIDTAANYLFKSDTMEIVFPDTAVAPGMVIPGKTMTAGAQHNMDVKIALLQPIYSGGILSAAIRENQAMLDTIALRKQLAALQVIAQVKTSYFNYQLLKKRLQAGLSLIERLRLHSDKLNRLHSEEQIEKSQVLETDFQMQEQSLIIKDLESAMDKEGIRFLSLTGQAIESVETGYTEFFRGPQQSIIDFKTHHPLYLSLKPKQTILQQRQKMAAGKKLPQMGVFSEVHLGKPGLDFFKNEWSIYFQGGLSISLNLLDWGKVKANRQQLSLEIEKLQLIKQDMEKQITDTLAQSYRTLQAAAEKLELIKTMENLAAQELAIKTRQFEEQQISNLDYLTCLSKQQGLQARRISLEMEHELLKVSINTLSGFCLKQEEP
jgi:outer membrane protein TolC